MGTSRIPRWRFWLRVVVILVLLYIIGYFAMMDRNLPTSPFRAASDYFESSFRWAPKQRDGKGAGPETQFPEVTIWNIIYKPFDKVYFRLFPRPHTEVERLRELGYYRWRHRPLRADESPAK
jgi:hypothetical protein